MRKGSFHASLHTGIIVGDILLEQEDCDFLLFLLFTYTVPTDFFIVQNYKYIFIYKAV